MEIKIEPTVQQLLDLLFFSSPLTGDSKFKNQQQLSPVLTGSCFCVAAAPRKNTHTYKHLNRYLQVPKCVCVCASNKQREEKEKRGGKTHLTTESAAVDAGGMKMND